MGGRRRGHQKTGDGYNTHSRSTWKAQSVQMNGLASDEITPLQQLQILEAIYLKINPLITSNGSFQLVEETERNIKVHHNNQEFLLGFTKWADFHRDKNNDSVLGPSKRFVSRIFNQFYPRYQTDPIIQSLVVQLRLPPKYAPSAPPAADEIPQGNPELNVLQQMPSVHLGSHSPLEAPYVTQPGNPAPSISPQMPIEDPETQEAKRQRQAMQTNYEQQLRALKVLFCYENPAFAVNEDFSVRSARGRRGDLYIMAIHRDTIFIREFIKWGDFIGTNYDSFKTSKRHLLKQWKEKNYLLTQDLLKTTLDPYQCVDTLSKLLKHNLPSELSEQLQPADIKITRQDDQNFIITVPSKEIKQSFIDSLSRFIPSVKMANPEMIETPNRYLNRQHESLHQIKLSTAIIDMFYNKVTADAQPVSEAASSHGYYHQHTFFSQQSHPDIEALEAYQLDLDMDDLEFDFSSNKIFDAVREQDTVKLKEVQNFLSENKPLFLLEFFKHQIGAQFVYGYTDEAIQTLEAIWQTHEHIDAITYVLLKPVSLPYLLNSRQHENTSIMHRLVKTAAMTALDKLFEWLDAKEIKFKADRHWVEGLKDSVSIWQQSKSIVMHKYDAILRFYADATQGFIWWTSRKAQPFGNIQVDYTTYDHRPKDKRVVNTISVIANPIASLRIEPGHTEKVKNAFNHKTKASPVFLKSDRPGLGQIQLKYFSAEFILEHLNGANGHEFGTEQDHKFIHSSDEGEQWVVETLSLEKVEKSPEWIERDKATLLAFYNGADKVMNKLTTDLDSNEQFKYGV